MSTFLLALLLAAPGLQSQTLPSQQPANSADVCTLQGMVVKAGTGEPLHKATVSAWPEVGRRGNQDPQGGSAETDATGQFEIKNLAPGRYYVLAQRNGFVRQTYGQRTPEGRGTTVTLSAGQKASNITFQMIPAAVITGHVYDEDGEPVLYAQVAGMRYAYMNGQRQLVMGGQQSMTNDLGEFRLFGLSPGQYYVQATLRSIQPITTKTQQGYAPIFYPGVPDAARATPITLRGGDEFTGADINLQAVHTFVVRGNVLNAGCGDSARGATVFLTGLGANQLTWQNPARPANPQGAFEIPNVIPGSYYLVAMLNEEGRRCFGRQTLEVTDGDLEGVTLTVSPGIDIKGRVRVEGQLDSSAESFSVALFPKNASMRFGGGGYDSTKPDGTFLLKNMFDGEYALSINNLPDNSFIKSARLEGLDVLPGLTIESKQAAGSLDIVVSPNGASVEGVVTKDQEPFPGATIAIVPDPPRRGETHLFKSTSTNQNGQFTLQGLAPGDYKVFAWEKIEPGAYTSPDFLQPYENLGQSVHITEGSHNSVQLELIPAKDAGP